MAAAAGTGAVFAAVLGLTSHLSAAAVTAGIVALLAGSYLLRRYARARLLYERHDDALEPQALTSRRPPGRR
jgi:hypothetical protein